MKTTSIELVQNPIIRENLREVGKSVTDRLEILNINGQVATVDTVKALKELRAELNKELAEFENQRKIVKEGVMSPYNEFETLYKSEISEKYKGAIDTLKDKIAIVEDKVKTEKRDNIRIYFDELCISESIDFISFDGLNLDINLSTSEKKYKEQCNTFIERVKDDLALIDTQEFKAEIIVAYKKNLNASKAIKDVQDRKEAEKREIERLKVQEENRRKATVKMLGMVFEDITNSWTYDYDIYILQSDLVNFSAADFNKKIVEIEEAIKTRVRENAAKKAEAKNNECKSEAPIIAPAAPLQAPAITEPAKQTEPIVAADFHVEGTMTQLRALGQYMKLNNITYKNI